MIDPATGWFEVVEIPKKSADVVSNAVELTWLTRYPRPSEITMDRGTEFMAEFTAMIKNGYGIETRPTTTHNPQTNAIIEQVHQKLGNVIRSFQLHKTELDKDDPWSGILATAMYAIRATIHTTLKAAPTQLVFGRNANLNISFEADWHRIQQQKQKLINKNYAQRNKKPSAQKYSVGDCINIKQRADSKFGANPYSEPVQVVQVNDNGTIRYTDGTITDTINNRNVHPYHN